jgi:hypothetical protein
MSYGTRKACFKQSCHVEFDIFVSSSSLSIKKSCDNGTLLDISAWPQANRASEYSTQEINSGWFQTRKRRSTKLKYCTS